jgi:hypothetical protein
MDDRLCRTAGRDPQLADAWGPNLTPPAGTRQWVTRDEVWRFLAVEGEPGFVSVALIPDIDAKGDLMQQMDDHINEWRDALSNDDRHPRRRR